MMIKACPFTLSQKEGVRVLWEITSKCNLNCKHCLYFNYGKKESGYEEFRDLKLDEIKALIANIKKDGVVKNIWLSGGEPLVRTDILDIIREISAAGIKPSISTNGTLLSLEIARDLKKLGVDYVHMSIDGIDAKTHDNFRQKKGAYEKTVLAIDYLHDSNIRVGITYIVTEDNVNDIEEMIHFANMKQIEVLSFYLIEPLGRGTTIEFDRRSLMKELCRKIDDVTKKKKMQNIKIEVFRAFEASSGNYLEKCNGEHFLTITHDGRLTVCPWLAKRIQNTVSESVLNQEFEVARKKIQNAFIDIHRTWVNNLEKCQKCEKVDICGRGCPAVIDRVGNDNLCQYMNDVGGN